MTKFSFAQLEGLWIQAGGDPRYASIAAAVAMAESAGDSQSTGRNPGSTDIGLWQINGPGGGNPKFYDPLTNVKEAIRQSHNGIDWRPWCTAYADGACGTRGGGYSLSNSPAGRALRAAGGSTPPAPSGVSGIGGVTPMPDPQATPQPPQSQYNSNTCAWGIDLGTIGTPQSFFGFQLPSLQTKIGFCILSKTQVRALLGGIYVGAGVGLILFGTAALVAFSFKRLGALDTIAGATKSVPGVGKAGSKFASGTKTRVAKSSTRKPVVSSVPPPGPKPKRVKKPPMGQNNPRTEKKYREAFERGEGE